MEIVAKAHAHNLVKWAQKRPEVLVLSADLTSSSEIDLFRDAYPERFFSMGIAEQNMLSFAGGLAREGFKPFIHTFAVFIYRRAYDQIAMSVAYPNLPVTMIGFLPGVMTPGGASHQAIEDISVMRSLPNMTILECGDATDVESVLDAADQVNGPVYVRMLRGEIPRLFPQNKPLQFNRARLLSQGTDIALFSSGICTEEALRAVQVLQKQGVSINHMHISTLKPFDDPAVMEAVAEARYGVITMENHSIIGGLGTILAEKIAEAGLGRKLMRLGIKDVFLHGASKAYLMKEYGLDAMALIAAIEKLLNTSFGIQESDLAAVYLAPVHSAAKAEAL
ncbi:MAG TPA: transketolase C-terminal domain-containing protein [Desulfitobacteriaceae bacterium]|nr:transketolase C-terminal domain-containing protein [Desulfitobacteriaceae bacterium]